MNPILNILIINVQIATHFKCVTIYMVKVSINLRENVVQKNLREISGITLIKKEFLKKRLGERERLSTCVPPPSSWFGSGLVLEWGPLAQLQKKKNLKLKSILKFGKLDTKLQPHNTYNLIIIWIFLFTLWLSLFLI